MAVSVKGLATLGETEGCFPFEFQPSLKALNAENIPAVD
jgi:hypothetical protein